MCSRINRGRALGVPVAHGLEKAPMLLDVPFAETLELVDARAALDHERDERLDHRAQHLVVRGLGEQDVERRGGSTIASMSPLRRDSCTTSAAAMAARSSSVRRLAARRATSTSTIRRASMNSFVTPRSSAEAMADGSLVCGVRP